MAKNEQKQYAAIYYKRLWWNDNQELAAELYYHLYTGEPLWEDKVVYDDIEEVRQSCKNIETLLEEREKKKNLERFIKGEPETKPGDGSLYIGYKIYDEPTDIKSWLGKKEAEGLITDFADDEDE